MSEPSPFTLRALRPGEEETLLPLMQAFYTEEHLVFDRATILRALRELLSDERLGRIFWLEQDGEPLGYLAVMYSFILEFGGRQAFLDELYLRPEARGRGFAQRSLELLITKCQAEGQRALRLEVDVANTRAIALYQRAGFVRHPRNTMTRQFAPPVS